MRHRLSVGQTADPIDSSAALNFAEPPHPSGGKRPGPECAHEMAPAPKTCPWCQGSGPSAQNLAPPSPCTRRLGSRAILGIATGPANRFREAGSTAGRKIRLGPSDARFGRIFRLLKADLYLRMGGQPLHWRPSSWKGHTLGQGGKCEPFASDRTVSLDGDSG